MTIRNEGGQRWPPLVFSGKAFRRTIAAAVDSLLAQQHQRINRQRPARRDPGSQQPQQRHRQNNTAQHHRIARCRRYTMDASTRLARIPRSNPAAEPIASNLTARPNAVCNTSLRCAPSARRMPNSRSRLLTEYAAIPKMPVIDRIAPIIPSTPRAIVAMRAGNRTRSSCAVHVVVSTGSPASNCRNWLLIAAASCCGSRLDRTTRFDALVGDCRNGGKIAGCWILCQAHIFSVFYNTHHLDP